MRFDFVLVLMICLATSVTSQNKSFGTAEKSPGEEKQETIHALLNELTLTSSVPVQLRILDSLSMYYLYFSTKTDSSLYYSNKSTELALNLPDKRPLILAYARRANYFWQKTNMKSALESSLQGIQLSNELNIPDYLSTLYNNIINIYGQYHNNEEILKNTNYQLEYATFSKDPFFDQRLLSLVNLGNAYLIKNQIDSADFILSKAYETGLNSKDQDSKDLRLWIQGRMYAEAKKYALADSVYKVGVQECKKNYDNQILNAIYNEYAYNFLMLNDIKKSIATAKLGLKNSRMIQDHFSTLLNAELLYDNYEKLGLKDSSLYYLKMVNEINSKIFSSNNISGLNEVFFSDQIKQRENKAAKILQEEKEKSTLRLYGFVIALTVFLIIGIIIWRNNKQRAKSFAVLQQQKNETDIQKSLVEQALEQLKSTQSQLIQKEKMASLGELTAGIAHEIQNPLNFVNNFSEINKELLDEIEGERRKENGERDELAQSYILRTINENQDKILHHGKRADAIVKSMLQHSRKTDGDNKKEPTDINALADEYFRLAYHGLKAKDKTFNSRMESNFDPFIGNINIIPQQIGRVLLNLINNAFYAVHEKKKMLGESFDPLVSVTTIKNKDKVEIKVKDNGNGIPQQILDKIFQPFFTTKPTGQGTGLGLSLAYDIVKAHGGTLKVETKEARPNDQVEWEEGTTFIIQIPEGK